MKLTSLLLGTVFLFSAGCADATAVKNTTSDTPDDPYVLMELFGSAYQLIKQDYVEETTDRQLVENAISGMLSGLDPHSVFLNQEDMEDMETSTKGEFGGLGMEVSADKGLVRVMSPIDDTPAYRAGIQTGDYITHIDGESLIGLSLTEAVKRMRGKPGTKITLTIARGDKEPFDVKLKRDIIKVDPVKYEAKGDVGYIRVIQFSDHTSDKIKEAITNINKEIGKDKVLGYILDVRNNPGGLLTEAVNVSDVFLSEGEIVSTRSRRPEESMSFSAKTPDFTNGKPLVVLINEGSASASEIVAGALQDHRRALIVGEQSFGKGSVQAVRDIPGFGGIKLTISRYYTPSGRSIQAKGIEPDIVIPRAKLEEFPAVRWMDEKSLPGAISAEEGKKAKDTIAKETAKKKAQQAVSKNKGSVASSDEKDTTPATDYQLNRAIDILRGIALYQQADK